jgi:hypothetical protein
MSYDREIDQVCPHYTVQEALYPGYDGQTIYPQRPIASTSSVVIRLDGYQALSSGLPGEKSIYVPSSGVQIAAQAVGSIQAPFNIVTGVNDKLLLKVNQGTPQTIVLPALQQVMADKLALILNQQGLQGAYFVAIGNQVGVTTMTEGAGTSLFFPTGSTMCSALGFRLNREFRGQQLVPGWTIINDPKNLTQTAYPNRLILFDLPLKSGTDFVEINYTTVSQMCRRCGGTGVENDWRVGAGGDVVTVFDDDLLVQEMEKDFFTTLGSNQFHTWYGTNLLDTIGKKLTSGGFIQNLIVSDIYQAFSRWQQIKQQQEQDVGQIVTDKEFPNNLLAVNLQQSQQDPTVIWVNVTIQNRSNQPITLTRGLRVPQPVDLMGATQQQGLIRQSLSNFVLVGP